MTLDIAPLENAIARLREGLVLHAHEPTRTIIRDGLVQRFAFTYALSHRMLKRALAATAADPGEIDRMGFADLIRAGSAAGLLAGGWPRWRVFRDMRARTSHTYNEAVAREVVAGIEGFLTEAEYLRDRLRACAP